MTIGNGEKVQKKIAKEQLINNVLITTGHLQNVSNYENVERAINYVEVVQETLTYDKYREFIELMKDIKYEHSVTRTVNLNVVKRRIKYIYEGHPELIEGFNNYMPAGHKIDM